MLVTTHYMDEAEYCSEVILMRDGRIAAAGRPGDLKRNAFPGKVAEIECEGGDRILAVLRGQGWIEEAAVFGSRIHAALAPGYGLERLETVLEGAGVKGIRIRETEPSLEDAFLKIVSSRPDAAAAGAER